MRTDRGSGLHCGGEGGVLNLWIPYPPPHTKGIWYQGYITPEYPTPGYPTPWIPYPQKRQGISDQEGTWDQRYPTPPEQTDIGENITFPLRSVIIIINKKAFL